MKDDSNSADATQRSIEVQAQIRRTAEEHGNVLRELQEWEESMKRREANLKKQQQQQQSTSAGAQNRKKAGGGQQQQQQQQKILDNQPSAKNISTTGSSTKPDVAPKPSPPPLFEPATQNEDKSPKEIANDERQRGNAYYAQGCFDDAIKCYTTCIRFDPQSTIAYSNRGEHSITIYLKIGFALQYVCPNPHTFTYTLCNTQTAMAHLKKKDWTKAEEDATSALSIDPAHIKSYQRRCAARSSLGKLRSALLDLSHAETVASKQQDGSNCGSGNGNSGIGKAIASEKRRVEALLRAAMKRAPRRSIPIVIEEAKQEPVEDMNEEDEAKEEMVSLSSKDHADVVAVGVLEEPHQATIVRNSQSNNSQSNAGKENVADDSSKSQMAVGEPPVNTSSSRRYRKPSTWYEFESIWHSLGSQNERSSFLATIKPKTLAMLYRNGIEDVAILAQIVVAAADIADGTAADYIRCVANTKCIDIPVLMMTSAHKEMIREAVVKSFGGKGRGDGVTVAAKLGVS